MNALLDGDILNTETAMILQNRGFRFGDGCFETMLVLNGVCPLLSQHKARLRKSLSALNLQWPEKLQLEEQLKHLGSPCAGWQRVRLWVWRTGAGLYTPEGTAARFMLAAEEGSSPRIHIKGKCLISEEVILAPSRWSFIKSISAQPYILAGLEKKEREADELILQNQRGEVAEACSANLFWKKRKRWYTPALESGCVAGVMRSWIMKQLLQKGEPVFEVLAPADELLKVDKLVGTNVTGLQPIQQLQDTQYDTDVNELWSLMPEEYTSQTG